MSLTSSLQYSPVLYRIAAVASLLTVITTLGLIFLPDFWVQGSDFETRMARVQDPAYQLRSYIYLVHPFLVLTAAVAVALRLRRHQPGLALFGALGFVLWAFTEAGQQTWTLFAFDRWRLAYLAGDEVVRSQMAVLTRLYDGLWDSLYTLLLIGFAIGNLLYSIALLKLRGLSRVLGGFYFAAFFLTFSLMVIEFGGPDLMGPISTWAYPAIQPLGRTLIGIWLWRAANENRPLPGETATAAFGGSR